MITLKWLDSNEPHRTEIWRSDEPFDTDLRGAELIGTVGLNVNQFNDTTTVYMKYYYYRLVFKAPGFNPLVSRLYQFKDYPYNGPGPTELKFGDENFGYFGKVTETDFVPSWNEIAAVFGITDTGNTPGSAYPQKFAVAGEARYIYTIPVADGSSVAITYPILQLLHSGGIYRFTKGLHEWALILPSGGHEGDENHPVNHYPGELRSMLSVLTNTFAPPENNPYSNTSGQRISVEDGRFSLQDMLETEHAGKDIKYITTVDWTNNVCRKISWTPLDRPYPLPSNEFITVDVENDAAAWEKTVIWPILVYIGIKEDGSQ